MAMTWGYIAGFFDGEGSIGVASHPAGRRATAYIAQSGEVGLNVLNEIRDFMHSQEMKSSVFRTGKAGKGKRTKPSYRLGLGGFTSTIAFLIKMLPYLRIKRTQAQDVIRYNILYPSIQTSPLTAAWRREKQIKHAVRGDAWKARYAGRKMGRPKGSLDSRPRVKKVKESPHEH